MRKKIQKISLIGPGSVGRSLLRALGANGFEIVSVYSRRRNGIITAKGEIEFDLQADDADYRRSDLKSSETLKRGLPATHHELGDLLFLTTPDDSIDEIASELAGSGLDWTSKYVVHCSGVRSSSALDALSDAGAVCASFHPMQTFPSSGQVVDGKNLFLNIPVGIEGDPALTNDLSRIAESIGARPILLNKKQKQLLHVAAVFISNYNVVLAAIADELLQGELDNEDVHLLDTLLLQTAENISSTSPSNALTGPISRGDVATVQQHLDILRDWPGILSIYKALGEKALEVTLKSKSLPGNRSDHLKKLLE